MMNNEKIIQPVISDKSYSVPIEMRPLWRMCLILISVMVVSEGKKYLDTKKANILVWMLIRKSRWAEYEDFLLNRKNDVPLVSVDTATYKALEFLVTKQLVTLENGRVVITAGGEKLFAGLVENTIMEREVSFLESFGKKLTDEKVKRLTGRIR